MVKARVFLAKVEEIAVEDPKYEKGKSGDNGTCDCIGLIIGAIRRAGGSWKGTHGTNYAARNEMDYLYPIAMPTDLIVGEVVYKSYEPGESGYDEETIKRKYASSPDQRDYYHIGVVESVQPLMIRHMTSPRPKMDYKVGNWKWHGWLKKIDNSHEQEGGDSMEQYVIISGGNLEKPINMRSQPSAKSDRIAQIPQGSIGVLLEDGDIWCKVRADGKVGYVMKDYVGRTDFGGSGETVSDTVEVNKADLEKIYDMIGNWLGLRG